MSTHDYNANIFAPLFILAARRIFEKIRCNSLASIRTGAARAVMRKKCHQTSSFVLRHSYALLCLKKNAAATIRIAAAFP